MEWDDILRELISVVRAWPPETLFTKDSSMDLARQLVYGVSVMIVQNRTTGDDVARARDSVSRLLEEMEVERRTLGLSEFTEGTLAGANFRLCPGFWPFC